MSLGQCGGIKKGFIDYQNYRDQCFRSPSCMAVSTSYPRHLLFGEKEEKRKKSNYLLLFFRNFYLKRCYFFPFDFNFKKMKLISLEYLACYLARYPPSYPPGPSYRTSYPTNIYPLSAWLSVVIHPVISLVICPVI